MVVGIRVIAENVKLGTVKHTNSSFFTMVAKGEDDMPTTVPQLILENDEDVKRFIESMQMRDVKRAIKEKMDDSKSKIQVKNAAEVLKNQRCIITYK
jgi:acyl-CoA hydrolase